MTKIAIFTCFSLLLLSCGLLDLDKDNYPKDPTVSEVSGKPKDPASFYYPTIIQKDNRKFKIEMDTFYLIWFSSALFAAEETILFNYYLGHDIYRFLWLRSFHRPVVIAIHKDGDKVWLTTKELDRQPNFIEPIYAKFVPPTIMPNGEIDTTDSIGTDELQSDSVSMPKKKASIILNQTIQLSNTDWEEFESIINECSFWDSPPHSETNGNDGSRWIIEGHIKSKYWFVNRWSPETDFRKAGLYLIRKSGLKEEIY